MKQALLFAVFTVLLCAACGGDDADATCPTGQELCDGICATLNTDRDNCGECGDDCDLGHVCNGSGSCELSCPSGLVDCEGSCRDTDYAPGNCGECCTICGESEFCVGGRCESSCGDLTDCDGVCKDTDVDPANCGDCGDECAEGEVCDAGTCASECPPGLIDCGGTCIDPDTDERFCGASGDCAGDNDGDVCPAGQVCDGDGNCALSCQEGLINCGGTCIDPDSNPTYCGASGNCIGANDGEDCAGDQACVGGNCVDMASICGDGLTSFVKGGVEFCYTDTPGTCNEAHLRCEALGDGYRLMCGDDWQDGRFGTGCGGAGAYTAYDFVQEFLGVARGGGSCHANQTSCVWQCGGSCVGDCGTGSGATDMNGWYMVCAPKDYFTTDDDPAFANVCGN